MTNSKSIHLSRDEDWLTVSLFHSLLFSFIVVNVCTTASSKSIVTCTSKALILSTNRVLHKGNSLDFKEPQCCYTCSSKHYWCLGEKLNNLAMFLTLVIMLDTHESLQAWATQRLSLWDAQWKYNAFGYLQNSSFAAPLHSPAILATPSYLWPLSLLMSSFALLHTLRIFWFIHLVTTAIISLCIVV